MADEQTDVNEVNQSNSPIPAEGAGEQAMQHPPYLEDRLTAIEKDIADLKADQPKRDTTFEEEWEKYKVKLDQVGIRLD